MVSLARKHQSMPVATDAGALVMALRPVDVRGVVLDSLRRMGEGAGLARWAKRNNDNETLYWTKLVPKMLPRMTELSMSESIEEKLAKLDGGAHACVVSGTVIDAADDSA